MTVRVELNDKGVQELLKHAAIQRDLKDRGDRIAAAAGPGNEATLKVGAERARVTVRTATKRAMRREARDRSLLSALDAGR